MSNIRIDFRKNPEFFDEETADMYARMLAMIMQMSAGMFKNFFGSNNKES